MTVEAHIVALGGGGFSIDPLDPRIDDYALRLSGAAVPKVCFVPTASGDADHDLDAFYAAFGPDRAHASHIGLFNRKHADLSARLADVDVIYIGGGNPANLLALWRLHGLGDIVSRAYRAGVVVVGHSAGASVLFHGCLTDSFGSLTAWSDGLGLLEGSFCPHAGNSKRLAKFKRVVADGFLPGLALDDGAAAHFVDGRLDEALITRDGARARLVSAAGEELLDTRLLEPT